MTVAQDLQRCADLCKASAERTLALMLGLGTRPEKPAEALLYDQEMTRLQGQLNSASTLNSKLTAAAVIQGLGGFEEEMRTIGEVSERAQARIARIRKVSELLSKVAKVLDLGLALLAAASAPSPVTIAAAVAAGAVVVDEV